MSEEEKEIRIRKIFDIKNEKDLLSVTVKTLKIYCDYLEKSLDFPFNSIYTHEKGFMEDEIIDLKIIRLLPFSEMTDDGFYGLFCEGRDGRRKRIVPVAEIEVQEKGLNKILIDDYNTWFWNYR